MINSVLRVLSILDSIVHLNLFLTFGVSLLINLLEIICIVNLCYLSNDSLFLFDIYSHNY